MYLENYLEIASRHSYENTTSGCDKSARIPAYGARDKSVRFEVRHLVVDARCVWSK